MPSDPNGGPLTWWAYVLVPYYWLKGKLGGKKNG